MYSNQKDQIGLEEAYTNVHGDNINEAQIPDASFGTAVQFFGIIALPVAMEFILNKYRGVIKNKNIKQLTTSILTNIRNNTELQKKIESIKKEADASNNQEYTLSIKKLLSDAIRKDTNFSTEIENKDENRILDEIMKLLPNNFSGKTDGQIKQEVLKNINNTPKSSEEIHAEKRRRLGLAPVRTTRV